MPDEGEVMKEVRKVSMSEKEGNSTYLSGKKMMESVGSIE